MEYFLPSDRTIDIDVLTNRPFQKCAEIYAIGITWMSSVPKSSYILRLSVEMKLFRLGSIKDKRSDNEPERRCNVTKKTAKLLYIQQRAPSLLEEGKSKKTQQSISIHCRIWLRLRFAGNYSSHFYAKVCLCVYAYFNDSILFKSFKIIDKKTVY